MLPLTFAAASGARRGKGQAAVYAADDDALPLAWIPVVRAMAAWGRSHTEIDGL
jgi:hypothetical protein